jgi:dCTP deaminase
MILSDTHILENLKSGAIVISPFNQENLNPCSVDLTIAPDYKVYADDILDAKQYNRAYELKMEGHGVLLEPGRVYLYRCNERIGCKGNIRAKVEGKSSLGRLGLFVHVTAGFIDPGFEGSLVLELVATQPVRIYPNMKICQVEFAYVQGEIAETYDMKAGSKYHGQTGVQESLYHKNFDNADKKVQ